MSYGTPTSAPQMGRIFLRSHGDCFIHATQWWLKYWNFSLTKEQLAIVRVSLMTGDFFLATLCPAPLPYENVHKGVRRKQYLEIDPKFALQLGIGPDTEVVVESIGAVEDCISLVLAPVTPSDYDKLENFIEKIDYELTDRIRVVSCRYSFPVWIDNLVIPIKVVKSDPSANWVLLVPGRTTVQLQRDASSPSTTGGASALSTLSTPGPNAENPLQSDTSTISTVSLPPTQQMASRHWDFSSSYTNHKKPSRKKSSSSSKSSTTGSSVDASPTEEEASDQLNQSLVSFSGFLSNYVGNLRQKLFSRESSQVDEERPSKLELSKEKSSLGASLDSVGFEPQQCFSKVSLKEVSSRNYPIQEEGLVTKQPSSTHKQPMGEPLQTLPLYKGSSPHRNVGSHSTTPDPPPGPSMSSSSDPADKARKPSHQRYYTWHSSSDFIRYGGGGRDGRGAGPPIMPMMSARVRVQPHEITGVCSRDESSLSSVESWSQERLFDVFVHPSTIPEVFHYWYSLDTEPFPVELVPIKPTTSEPKESKNTTVQDDLNELKAESRSVSSTQSSTDAPATSPLPSSLVVRLCFATKLRIQYGEMVGVVDDDSPQREQSEGEDRKETSESLEVPVNVGHVLMSDMVRVQLGIKACSLVRLLHVKDAWRIPYTDKPSLILQPLRPEHKRRSGAIKNGMEVWIKRVHQLSRMDAVLVDKQIIPVIRSEQGDWIHCRVSIKRSSARRISSRVRIQYLMVTPSDVEAHKLPLHVDTVPSSSNGSHFGKPILPRISRDPSPSREEVITLPAIQSLNQPTVLLDLEHFRALEHLYTEGVQYLETAFTQLGKGGALLVCGVSGSGGSGCGKTTLARLLCKAVSGHPHYANLTFIDCTALRGLTTHNFKKRLRSYFTEAILNQPSVILLDDLDHSIPQVSDAQEQVGEEGNASIRKSQVMLGLLDLIHRKEARVVVIATSQNRQQLNKALLQSRGTHVFDKTLEITPPTLADRKVILSSILITKALNVLTDQELRTVAVKTEGFQPGDLVTLVDRAVSLCELRTLYPQGVGSHAPSSPDKSFKFPGTGRVATDGYSSDLELSSSPVKISPLTLSTSPSLSTPPSSPRKYIFRNPSEKNPSLKHLKKTSVVSTGSATTLIPERSASHEFRHSTSLSQMRLCVDDFVSALKGFVPLSLRGLPLHQSGTINFSGVGGLETVKKCLKETLLWPSKYPRLFGQCSIKQRCGVLLYGAPGTGKTMLAGAVAKEFSLNFVSIKGPELLSKYIGASEQAVRDVFTRALCAKPCILFFDEFDSLAPRRGHDNTGVTDRVVNQLLTQLDGVEALQGVYVLAASSRPDLIDPALLRPGRIDRNLLCNMPTEDERREILVALSKDMPLAPGVNMKVIAGKAKGMTGADLKAVLYSAQLQAAHESLTSKQGSREPSLTESSETLNTPNTSGRGSSVASGSGMRPLVFNFSGGSVQKMSQLSSSMETKSLALQQRGSFFSRQRRRSTLTPSDIRLFDKKKKKGVVITQEHLLAGLNQVQPSLTKDELKKFNQIYDKFSGKTKTTLETIKPVATMA